MLKKLFLIGCLTQISVLASEQSAEDKALADLAVVLNNLYQSQQTIQKYIEKRTDLKAQTEKLGTEQKQSVVDLENKRKELADLKLAIEEELKFRKKALGGNPTTSTVGFFITNYDEKVIPRWTAKAESKPKEPTSIPAQRIEKL